MPNSAHGVALLSTSSGSGGIAFLVARYLLSAPKQVLGGANIPSSNLFELEDTQYYSFTP